MQYPQRSKKLNAGMVKFGNAYDVLSTQEDDIHSEESRLELTKAQTEAQKLLQDALIQVEDTITQAQTEAAIILQQAQEDAMKIQAQAQEAGQKMGYDAGYQAGYNQAVEESVNVISSAQTIINGAYQAQKEILLNTEAQMLELIIAITRKIINKEQKTQPDIILRMAEAAIKELKDREHVRLIVNPVVVTILTKAAPLLKKRINSLETIKIIEDKSIPPGGVIVESSGGKIDAQVDTQLEEIFNKLIEESCTNPALMDIPEPKTMTSDGLKKFLDQQNTGAG